MKELLQVYSLARPWIRLRFAVLKTPTLAWSFAPVPKGDVRGAATQVFGAELASQCIFQTYHSTNSTINQADEACQSRDNSLVFEALLPSPTADPNKVAKGGYFSVDSRPVASSKGTAKKLYAAFKKILGDHFSQNEKSPPNNPFLRLNILCTPGSYDVNVEPAKDDILFRDEDFVLIHFESFLTSVYLPSGKISIDEISEIDPDPSAHDQCEQSVSCPILRVSFLVLN